MKTEIAWKKWIIGIEVEENRKAEKDEKKCSLYCRICGEKEKMTERYQKIARQENIRDENDDRETCLWEENWSEGQNKRRENEIFKIMKIQWKEKTK